MYGSEEQHHTITATKHQMQQRFASTGSPAFFSKVHDPTGNSSAPASPMIRSAPRTPALSSGPSSPLRTKQGCHSPYAASVLPPSMHQPMSPTVLPASLVNFADALPKYEDAVNHATSSHVAHSTLTGRVAYITIPNGLKDVVVDDQAGFNRALQSQTVLPQPVFFGQVRFETTAGELQWLLATLLGVQPLKIESRGKGCFAAVLRSEQDAEKVRSLHKALLFDYSGVWYAKTREERDVLAQCAREYQQVHSSRQHLPKDCVVVEDQKVKPAYMQHQQYHATVGAATAGAAGRWSSHETSGTAAHPPACAPPPPPSYSETVAHDVSLHGVTTSSSLASSVPSLGVSLEGSPAMLPRYNDSAAMSPVVSEAPRYAI